MDTHGLQEKIIAGVLLGGDFEAVASHLTPEHFVGPKRRAWEEICELKGRGEFVDEIVLRSKLPQLGEQIDRWVDGCVTTANIAHWASVIADVRRQETLAEKLREAHELVVLGVNASHLLDGLSAPQAQGTGFSLETAEALLPEGKPPPEASYLLETVMSPGREPVGAYPAGRVGMLAAEGGAGKTWVLIQLAVAVATGGIWLGSFRSLRAGKVLMLLGEETGGEIGRRLWHSMRGRRDALRNIYAKPLAGKNSAFVTLDGSGNPVTTPFFGEVVKAARKHEWELVIVDPIARFACQGVETDASIATRFVSAVEQLTELPGNPSVLMSHHTTKIARGGHATSASAARGSSALTDGVRWQANLEALPRIETESELCRLRVTKSNLTAKPAPVTLAREPGKGGMLRKASRSEYQSWLDAMKKHKENEGM